MEDNKNLGKGNKYLEQVLENLPKGIITYTQKPNEIMNIAYTLQAKDYTELYLDNHKLEDLTPEEQLILLNSNDGDPTYTPQTMLAGIFRARNIRERSNDNNEAIAKCNDSLIDINHKSLQKHASISEVISQKRIHANLLEYYLSVEQKSLEYEAQQKSIAAPIKGFVNRILERITRKPHGKPPYSQDERDRGAKEWEKFRAEQNADSAVSNEELLKRFRYNSNFAVGSPFEFLYHNPELSALDEEYAITMNALKVLDGSAYQKATRSLNRNPRKYLEHIQSLGTVQQK